MDIYINLAFILSPFDYRLIQYRRKHIGEYRDYIDAHLKYKVENEVEV
jgi:hypothetical protein